MQKVFHQQATVTHDNRVEVFNQALKPGQTVDVVLYSLPTPSTDSLHQPATWEEPSPAWTDLAAIDLAEHRYNDQTAELQRLIQIGVVQRLHEYPNRYSWQTSAGQTVVLNVQKRPWHTRVIGKLTKRQREPFGHYTNYISQRTELMQTAALQNLQQGQPNLSASH